MAVAIMSPSIEIHRAMTWRIAPRPVLKIQPLTELGYRRIHRVCTEYYRVVCAEYDCPPQTRPGFTLRRSFASSPSTKLPDLPDQPPTGTIEKGQGTKVQDAGCRHTVQSTVVTVVTVPERSPGFNQTNPFHGAKTHTQSPPRRELPPETLFMQDKL
jgi:hypothetical protein